MLWGATDTFEFGALFAMARDGSLPREGLGLVLFLIYLGAVGKSAQFPLHVWLPDAMEGPTPVSALIHAATMVTAGVFLVTRIEPLLALAPGVLTVIGVVGAFTALLAATMACVESDIKRVLAYSTVSQLGYMMAAAGAGFAAAGFFHLLTHGVFKALLFLAAGAVIHAVGTNDMFRMGGLVHGMRHTAIVFIVGTLALAGVPPLAGFFSKEAILAGVWESGMLVPFSMLLLTAFLTAFYMTRAVVLAFFGRPHAPGHAHEAPWLMRGPLWILAVLTVALGIRFAVVAPAGDAHHAPAWLAWLSVALALAGIAFAWAVYQRDAINPAAIARAFGPLDFMARRRYGIDAIYGGVYRGFILGFSALIGWLDRYVVDGILNVVSALSLRAGDQLRRIQTGQPQDYVYGVAFGVLFLIVVAQWWAR
jgi:NADH-quinone oxidoreductase subunit L